ncbi:MAG: hypothetical protein HGGPFJEG_00923 [Ignavibacteria bacterium]|nr:hypothetical protein [Ignavibacteria bacterium]
MLKFLRILFLTFSIGIFLSIPAYSQDKSPKGKQTDLKDVLKDLFGSKKDSKDTGAVKDYSKVSFSLLPGVAYSTSTGFLVGFNLSMSKYFGNPDNTSLSAATLSSNYTSKNQFNLKYKTDFYTSKNSWYIEGDYRFSLTSQQTFGLGTATPKSNEQRVNYNQFRLYQKFSKRTFGNLYLGAAFYFDKYNKINTEDENEAEVYPNFHNEYNKIYNYDTASYNNTGFGIQAEFDSRDNVINPYKGFFVSLRYNFYQKFFSAQSIWQGSHAEFRTYQSFGKVNKHVLAFWLYGDFVVSGNPPYLILPAIGWDKFERSGRGYTTGRYRGKNLVYGEFEYRFPITSNGLFGGVTFVNVTSASDPLSNEELFEYLKPAYGLGLRIKFDKNSRTNICVDYGKASDGSSSFQFNLSEVF